tara:strand:+ start:283 stop:492 length:210 start_codon:yes stop_codon:yes gene_type:complete
VIPLHALLYAFAYQTSQVGESHFVNLEEINDEEQKGSKGTQFNEVMKWYKVTKRKKRSMQKKQKKSSSQ